MVRNVATAALVALTVLTGSALAGGEQPLICADDFEKGADNWQATDPTAWKITDVQGNKIYELIKRTSNYKPPHRSPYNISLLKDVVVGDCVLTLKLRSTRDTGNHRDLCLFFGYQDPAHYYYVHLGKRPDPHSSQIMIVNGAPRKMITTNKSPGIPWTDGWHTAKIVRRPSDGTIEIYFDNMEKPVMTANDKTFTWGQIGIGSFDDQGQFDDVRLYGKKVPKP